mgnify:CR=1 FL=1
MNTNFHNDTIKKLKKVSLESLLFIREDAYTASKVGDGFNSRFYSSYLKQSERVKQ